MSRPLPPAAAVTALVLGLVLSVLSALPVRAQGEPVAVELCLAVDGSGSIAQDEFQFQRQAYALAIADPRVVAVMARGPGVAVALMEWGGATSMHPIVDWRAIRSEADAHDFAADLLAAPRLASGWNSIANAIAFCHQWMDQNAFLGARRVIDVSGDAGNRGGMPLGVARQQAIDAGITINALALNYRGGGLTGPFNQPLLTHFQNDVIGGPGAFALAVEREEDFVEALVRKLVQELAVVPPTPSGPAPEAG